MLRPTFIKKLNTKRKQKKFYDKTLICQRYNILDNSQDKQ